MEKRILTQYSLFSLNRNYWKLSIEERKNRLKNFFKDVLTVSEQTWLYQIYPTQTKCDFLVWTNCHVENLETADQYFAEFARVTNRYRDHIDPVTNFWGMTKPSIYSKAKRSPQELDPFELERLPYFIAYPFSKTSEWYQLSREERQEMMNDHIKIGKSFKDITQLLLYSFGLQDQEFVVAYETHDLATFSDLVYELRMTKARIYTLNDTPIITGVYRTYEDLLKIFIGR